MSLQCIRRWSRQLAFLTLATASLAGQQVVSAPAPVGQETEKIAAPTAATAPAIGDAERSALTFTRYDLSVHLRPESSAISVLARVVVRNDGTEPLSDVALQVSSSLRWEGISQLDGLKAEKLSFNQHHLQTDADHTGEVSEAVAHLRVPLPVHGSTELSLLYSGEIRNSTEALDRFGVSASGSEASQWDLISPEKTFLRGFGSVLWYPVASPQVFLGEAANLVRETGRQMKRQSSATIRLHLSVEYTGDAPEAVFFCGREEVLASSRDNPDAPVADSPGVASADFPVQELGFRTPSLLITRRPVPVPGFPLALASSESGVPDKLSTASAPILSFLKGWFGQEGGRTLTVIDHPGAAFADGSLLVAPVSTADAVTLTSDLVPSLVHTRFHSSQVWLDQGMPQFVALLWIEQTAGRPAALAALAEQSHSLALAESTGASVTNRGLLETSDAIFYRNKAAAVLWMLRDIVGDAALKQALQRYGRDSRIDQDRAGFQKLLEEVSGKSLAWFFEDWVYHDQGLPDLSIVSVAARQLPSQAASGAGWLVAVEVRNDGAATAEVPVTVRSGTLTATERLRIGGHAVASVRVLFQERPEQVQVNDGTVPEMVSGTHVRAITAN